MIDPAILEQIEAKINQALGKIEHNDLEGAKRDLGEIIRSVPYQPELSTLMAQIMSAEEELTPRSGRSIAESRLSFALHELKKLKGEPAAEAA